MQVQDFMVWWVLHKLGLRTQDRISVHNSARQHCVMTARETILMSIVKLLMWFFHSFISSCSVWRDDSALIKQAGFGWAVTSHSLRHSFHKNASHAATEMLFITFSRCHRWPWQAPILVYSTITENADWPFQCMQSQMGNKKEQVGLKQLKSWENIPVLFKSPLAGALIQKSNVVGITYRVIISNIFPPLKRKTQDSF